MKHPIPGEPQPSEAVLQAQRENVWTIERYEYLAELCRYLGRDENAMVWFGIAEGLRIAERRAKGQG